MPAPIVLHGYDLRDVMVFATGGGRLLRRHSEAGAAKLNAAECLRTNCEFTLMLLVRYSFYFRCGMLLNVVLATNPAFIPSNLYPHPQTL